MLPNTAREGKEGSQGKGKQLHELSTGVVLDCLRSVPGLFTFAEESPTHIERSMAYG